MAVSRFSGELENKANKEASIAENALVSIVQIPKDWLLCPITRQVFFIPVTIDCNHIFEKYAIEKARQGDSRCPCCRAQITKISPLVTPVKEIMEMAIQNPAVQQDRYFHIEYFLKALRNKNVHDLKKIGASFKFNPEYLNTVIDWGPYKGTSAIFWFTGTHEGRELLEDQILRDKITSAGLNAISEAGPDKGSSPVYWLTVSPTGIELLKDQTLRDKITAVGLNAIIEEGPEKGASAVTWLAASSQGIELLKDQTLRDKITSAGLNTVIEVGPFKGASAVSLLAESIGGRTLLRNDPKLTSLIDSTTLNTLFKDPLLLQMQNQNISFSSSSSSSSSQSFFSENKNKERHAGEIISLIKKIITDTEMFWKLHTKNPFKKYPDGFDPIRQVCNNANLTDDEKLKEINTLAQLRIMKRGSGIQFQAETQQELFYSAVTLLISSKDNVEKTQAFQMLNDLQHRISAVTRPKLGK